MCLHCLATIERDTPNAQPLYDQVSEHALYDLVSDCEVLATIVRDIPNARPLYVRSPTVVCSVLAGMHVYISRI